jgi:geranylgeranyl transferase type-2 subunit beta
MYLKKLTTRLSDGFRGLPAEQRARHAAFIRSYRQADGGFAGREGGSDLYYTGFAVRALAMLGELTVIEADQTADFLRQRMTQTASVVDFHSLLYAALLVQMCGGPDLFAASPPDWPDRVAAALESFATPDGGYAKAAGAKAGSTYHTFLVGMTYELLGRAFPRPDAVLHFVESRRRDDGGYVEIGPLRRGGTNPTAAAVGIVQMVRGSDFDPSEMSHVADFLVQLVSMEGGLCANTKMPIADLLSTFTGTWTLEQLGALKRIDTAGVAAYARSLEQTGGGFRGGLWDTGSDLEYTFYGLGTLALCRD